MVQAHLAAQAFTGEGARLYGGRWNHPGTSIVYTAGALSLAMLELLVHVTTQQLLRAYVGIPVDVDESLVKRLAARDLPKGWRAYPTSNVTRDIGDAWVQEGDSAVLGVPSVIVPEEWNYLLNPAHRDFNRLRIGAPETIAIDPRLAKR